MFGRHVARTGAVNAISFALANHKEHYNRSHKPLFMKVGDWAMIKFHKGYSILLSVGVIKKLIQQYVGPFRIVKRVGRLAYKLDVSNDWKNHLVFSITQLELAPSPAEDLFQRLRPQHPPSVFVESDTDHNKSFETKRLSINAQSRKVGAWLSNILSAGLNTAPNKTSSTISRTLTMPPTLSRLTKRA